MIHRTHNFSFMPICFSKILHAHHVLLFCDDGVLFFPQKSHMLMYYFFNGIFFFQKSHVLIMYYFYLLMMENKNEIK